MSKRKDLTLLEYQEQAAKFRAPTEDTTYLTLNLISKIGDFYGIWARSIRNGTQPQEQEIRQYLGDLLWHLAALCHDCGTSISEVAAMNIHRNTKKQAKGSD